MKRIEGILNGELRIQEDSELLGMVNGPVTVLAGHLLLRGMVRGDVRVSAGASVDIVGMVNGDVVLAGGQATFSGIVSGRVRHEA